MKIFPEIKFNPFQLVVLLDEEERNFYSVVIANYVYCCHCRECSRVYNVSL